MFVAQANLDVVRDLWVRRLIVSYSLSHPVFYRATRPAQLNSRLLQLLPGWLQNWLHHNGVAVLVPISAYFLEINPKVSLEEMIKVARLHGYRDCPPWAIAEFKSQPQQKLSGVLFAPIGATENIRLRVERDHTVILDTDTRPPVRFSLLMRRPAS